MDETPVSLQRALESDCAETLSELIQAHRAADFDRLRQMLAPGTDVNPRHRQRAIYALGRWGDARAVGDILQVLPRLDEPGRLTAIDALGRLGSAEALPTILEHSDDPSPHVRKFVIHALGRFNLPDARAKLTEISEKDPDPALRKLAREYLDRDH